MTNTMFDKFMKTGNPKDFLASIGGQENENISASGGQPATGREQQDINATHTVWESKRDSL